MGPTALRRSLVDWADPLTVRRQCGLLGVSRCSVYYAPKGERAEPGEDAADDDPRSFVDGAATCVEPFI